MCGRFTLRTDAKEVAEHFELPAEPEYALRFNIAPTQPIAIVRYDESRRDRELSFVRWGLVPPWSKNVKSGPLFINARSETAASKPAFRQAMKKRRCLVVADGFYEWRRQGSEKQPFYIRRPVENVFAFAGLWERWAPAGKEPIESCTILTTDANALMRPIHERMPVILQPHDYQAWLDSASTDVTALAPLLCPCPEDFLTMLPVSKHVNSPRNDEASCIEPIALDSKD